MINVGDNGKIANFALIRHDVAVHPPIESLMFDLVAGQKTRDSAARRRGGSFLGYVSFRKRRQRLGLGFSARALLRDSVLWTICSRD